MSHTITITRLPDDEHDDYEYTIGGTHDGSCASMRECMKTWHRHPIDDERVGDEWATKRVPEEHQYLDGVWMVPDTRNCGIDWARQGDGRPDGIECVQEVGTYAVSVEWDGDWFWFLGDKIKEATE